LFDLLVLSDYTRCYYIIWIKEVREQMPHMTDHWPERSVCHVEKYSLEGNHYI